MKAWQRLVDGIDRFFLTPASAAPLAALRILVGLVLLYQAFLLRANVLDLLAHDGLVQGGLARYLGTPLTPSIAWLVSRLSNAGIGESGAIFAVCAAYIGSLVGLILGWHTRVSAAIAWLAHWTLMSSASTTMYGVDLYAHVFLFYLILVPAGDALSFDVRAGRLPGLPSVGARLGLRLCQLHLCVSYLCSGIDKAQGIQWWNGELLWRALNLPVYRQYDFTWLASWPALSRIGGIGTLVVELGYCVFIWPKTTRRLWVPAVVSMHLGIAVFLGLTTFGLIMAALTLALFGISATVRGTLAPAPIPVTMP